MIYSFSVLQHLPDLQHSQLQQPPQQFLHQQWINNPSTIIGIPSQTGQRQQEAGSAAPQAGPKIARLVSTEPPRIKMISEQSKR